MILTDAGPLIALLFKGDPYHRVCMQCLPQLHPPMLTTWPAVTEAMYALGEHRGWPAQKALWRLIETENVVIAEPTESQTRQMAILMEKYHDLPMDFADASLVALAQERGLRDVFTLDHTGFRVYRPAPRETFNLWPAEL